ncbi:MAG: M81 family metallopeptidase [Pseudomonadota bacterium]
MTAGPINTFVAALGAEVNTFAPLPINTERFEEVCLFRAGELRPGDDVPLIAAPLKRAWELEAQHVLSVHQGLCAGAQPGGCVVRTTYESLRDELLRDLRDAELASGKIELVLLGLHGATVAEGYPDCEGDLLRCVRDLVGSDVFVAALLDPHCHLSTEMLDAADLLTAYKEYPHTDIFPEAEQLVDLSVQHVKDASKPHIAAVRCQTMQVIHTTHGAGEDIVRSLRDRAETDGVVDLSIAHSFPWGDTADTGTAVWCTVAADRTEDFASEHAHALASELIAARTQTQSPAATFDEIMGAIRGDGEGPVVVADSADNPGGGAPSDGTQLIRDLLEAGVSNLAGGFLWDPGAFDLCRAAGEGAVIPLRVGGKVSRVSGRPLDLEVRVGTICPSIDQQFAGSPWPMGDAVAVHAENVSLVLTTRRTQCFDAEVFSRMGVDLTSKDAVVVKSSQHFRSSFAQLTDRIFYYEGEGALGSISSLPYRDITRPIWPVDSIEPKPSLFYGSSQPARVDGAYEQAGDALR